jgi:hypothetical protein
MVMTYIRQVVDVVVQVERRGGQRTVTDIHFRSP